MRRALPPGMQQALAQQGGPGGQAGPGPQEGAEQHDPRSGGMYL
jgi:hypothetical protein